MINLHNKKFRALENSSNGEVSNETTFHYRQKGDHIIWATYEGGAIRFGTLSGKINPNGSLYFQYQHESTDGSFKTGICQSTTELNQENQIILSEVWEWTSGGIGKGTSKLIEYSE